MTIEEFNNTRFGAGMKCIRNSELYAGRVYLIGSVDFYECLLEIYEGGSEDSDWVRCENITLI